MSEEPEGAAEFPLSEVVLEAIRKIRSEILAYAVVMALLLIASASLGLDVLRELRWPLVTIFTAALVAYFFARAMPRARRELRLRRSAAPAGPASPSDR